MKKLTIEQSKQLRELDHLIATCQISERERLFNLRKQIIKAIQ